MMDSETPPAPASTLTLPPAILHFPIEPHPDSDEHRQNDKHRTAKELNPILPSSSSRIGSSRSPNLAARPGPSSSPHSLYIYPRSGSTRSSPFLRSRQRRQSDISTAPDDDWEREAWRYRLKRQTPHWYDGIVRFWGRQISIVVDQGQQRDHLALERTFLGYLRTSVALAIMGVITAQLFRLQHSINPNPNLGFFVLGIPLAVIFIATAILVLLLGAFRFWKQQNALVRGKIHAGGWEINTIMCLTIVLCLATFALMAAIDIVKEDL
ncbi:hypothetical protein AOQ84DRAFT_347547 [Glonium stellatum]|uniref:DUF202 domain-containing protein n=1 Tax=Glonium stellatum TaxID=574774 RepID=A0A8E2ERM3_9PEZI|nr:hypothetical protein AOQ84DRAFT_347547 [Glonium stellatum]